MEYEVICARARGASHVKAGTPCEDFGLADDYGHLKVFVVSDGHGDKSCPRSDVGSRIACEIAQRKLVSFAEEIEEMDAAARESCASFTTCLLEKGEQEREARVRHLVVSIVGQWASEVTEDYKASPLSDRERSECSSYYLDLYDKGEKLEHIYGATLIAGLMTERYLLLIQQGDGRCDVFYEDASVEQPIPWDSRCVANVTTSLCDEDSVPSTRYCVIDVSEKPVMAVLAGSDGVEDTFFSMDGTHNFYRDLLIRAAETSAHDLQAWLDEYLPDFSREGVSGYGSQDDVTICGFIDEEMVKERVETLKLETQSSTLRANIRSTQDRLNSMEMGKLEYLRKRLAKVVKEENDAEDEYRSIIEQLEALRDQCAASESMAAADSLTVSRGDKKFDVAGQPIKDLFRSIARGTAREIRKLEARLPEAEKKYREANDKVEPARKELYEYTERRKSLESQLDRYQRELDELMGVETESSDDQPAVTAGLEEEPAATTECVTESTDAAECDAEPETAESVTELAATAECEIEPVDAVECDAEPVATPELEEEPAQSEGEPAVTPKLEEEPTATAEYVSESDEECEAPCEEKPTDGNSGLDDTLEMPIVSVSTPSKGKWFQWGKKQ